MTWLESIIYGFVSGFFEFIPVSSQAMQVLLLRLFGIEAREPVRDMLIHMAVLSALICGCWTLINRLRRDNQLAQRMHRAAGRQAEPRGVYDLRLIKTAVVPMAAGLFAYLSFRAWEASSLHIALFCIIGGLLIYIPEHIPHGNKDARNMSTMDAILISLCGILSAFPGISRVGTTVSFATVRGAGRQHAVNWALLLSIPTLAVFLVLDMIMIATASLGTIAFPAIAGYIASMLGAFGGGYLSVLTIRSITERTSFSVFAYFSWGMAMFSFVLYLIA